MTRAGRRLAHFLVRLIKAHHTSANRGQVRIRYDKRLAIQRIEASRDIASQFEMLRLVVADGDDGSLVQKNIGGHEHRILQDAVADGLLRRGFRLVLRHPLEPTDSGDAGEEPGEFRMGGYARLHHDGRFARIDPASNKQPGGFLDLTAQLGGVLVDGDGMQVYNAVDALVILLYTHPAFERAEIVTDV